MVSWNNNPTAHWAWKPRTRGGLPGLCVCVHALVRATDRLQSVAVKRGPHTRDLERMPTIIVTALSPTGFFLGDMSGARHGGLGG